MCTFASPSLKLTENELSVWDEMLKWHTSSMKNPLPFIYLKNSLLQCMAYIYMERFVVFVLFNWFIVFAIIFLCFHIFVFPHRLLFFFSFCNHYCLNFTLNLLFELRSEITLNFTLAIPYIVTKYLFLPVEGYLNYVHLFL